MSHISHYMIYSRFSLQAADFFMQLIIFSGVHAWGKSSFYLLNLHHSHLRMNLDMLKIRHRKKLVFEADLNSTLERNNQRTATHFSECLYSCSP